MANSSPSPPPSTAAAAASSHNGPITPGGSTSIGEIGSSSRSNPIDSHHSGNSSTMRSSDNGSSSSSSKGKDSELVVEWVVALGLSVLMGLTVRYLVSSIAGFMELDRLDDPHNNDRPSSSAVEHRLKTILAKRETTPDGKPTKQPRQVSIPRLNSYELMIAQVVLDPDEIDSSFADIGGLDKTKKEIYELAIMPLVEPGLFQGKLVQPCKGILLYGKPGTGKTMLAKALAKESTAVFIPLQLSNILNKYLGESNKMIAATFTLARKLSPAIIFIDELDTFLKANTSETAYLDTIKSEFLTWWDGIGTRSNYQVLVLGATNKPQAIDPAILRRMPRAFAVPLPDETGRRSILKLLFQDEELEPAAVEYLPQLARKTKGYSGSDLKELAKAAAMVSIQERTAEFARQRVMGRRGSGSSAGEKQPRIHHQPLRPISVRDLELGLQKVLKTGEAARSYGVSFEAEHAREEAAARRAYPMNGGDEDATMRQVAMLLKAMSNLSTSNNVSFGDMQNVGERNNGGEDDDDDEVPEVI